MAQRVRIVLPGGRIKRWKSSKQKKRWTGVPPRAYRNELNRRERRKVKRAVRLGSAHAAPYVHPREGALYWI